MSLEVEEELFHEVVLKEKTTETVGETARELDKAPGELMSNLTNVVQNPVLVTSSVADSSISTTSAPETGDESILQEDTFVAPSTNDVKTVNSAPKDNDESILEDNHIVIDLDGLSEEQLENEIEKHGKFFEMKTNNDVVAKSLGIVPDCEVELIFDPYEGINPPKQNKKGCILSEMPDIIQGTFRRREIEWAYLSCLAQCLMVLKGDFENENIDFGVINDDNVAPKKLWKWYLEKKEQQVKKAIRIDIGYSSLHFSTLVTILYKSTLVCFHYDPLRMHHPETGLWEVPFLINKVPAKMQNDSNSCGYLALAMCCAISKKLKDDGIPEFVDVVDWMMGLSADRNDEEFKKTLSFYLEGAVGERFMNTLLMIF